MVLSVSSTRSLKNDILSERPCIPPYLCWCQFISVYMSVCVYLCWCLYISVYRCVCVYLLMALINLQDLNFCWIRWEVLIPYSNYYSDNDNVVPSIMIKSVITLKISFYDMGSFWLDRIRILLITVNIYAGIISTQTNSRIGIFNRLVAQDLKTDSFVNPNL